MKTTKVIAICNQKGGVGKTTTAASLGVGLVRAGKRTLLIDADPQGDLTTCLGWLQTDKLENTLTSAMGKIIKKQKGNLEDEILHHQEGVDLVPANLELSAMEVSLVNAISRESVLRRYINSVKDNYDYILIDCMPSLGMITVNALAAADEIIIPVQANYLPAKGMTQLLQTIHLIKEDINPDLKIQGILLTLVDGRTNHAKQVEQVIRQNYGEHIRIFESKIPVGVKAAEVSAKGQSLFAYDPKGAVTKAYRDFVKEVLLYGERERRRTQAALIR